MLSSGAADYGEYYRLEDTAVAVTARISSMREDFDGGKTPVWKFSCCSRWIPCAESFVSLTSRTLNNICVGSDVYLALNKKGEIERIFDAKDFVI